MCQRGSVKRAALYLAEAGSCQGLPSHGYPPSHHTPQGPRAGLQQSPSLVVQHHTCPWIILYTKASLTDAQPRANACWVVAHYRREQVDRHNAPDPSNSLDSRTLCHTNVSLPPHPTRSQRWRPGSPPILLLFSRHRHGSSTCEPGPASHPGSLNAAFLLRCITMQFSWGMLRSKNRYYQKQLQWLMICTHTFC